MDMGSTNSIHASTTQIYEIAKNYDTELINFNNDMNDKIGLISDNLTSIKRNWNDDNFKALESIVNQKLTKLSANLEKLQELEKVVAETVQDFADAITIFDI